MLPPLRSLQVGRIFANSKNLVEHDVLTLGA